MFKKAGEKFVTGAMSKLKDEETEWIVFECFASHRFGLEVKKDMILEEHVKMLSSLTCPVCSSKSIKIKGGM